MSIFSEHQFSILEDKEIELISMSNHGLIALSVGNEVQFYNMNGERQEYQLVKEYKVSFLQWHPRQNILGIGYEKGQVTLYNNETMSAKEDVETHKQSKVVLMEFNQEGTRMISTDEKGLVVVWKGLQVMSKFQRENVINQITFCQLEFGDLEKDLKLKNSNLFFMGGKSGIVCLADDNKHCSEVCKVSGSIQSLLFYKQENSVVIITSTLLFVQFRISPNQKTTPDKKVKLSIYGDVTMLQSIWVGQDMLAISSNENIIRLWDIKQDQNYILNNSYNDKVIMIRSYKDGVIVGGTKDGRIIFWQQNSNGQDWRVKNSLFMNQIINDIKISQSNILLKYGNKIGLIQETKINGSIGSMFSLLQCDNKRVLVMDRDYDVVTSYRSKHTIKSLGVSNENKVVIQTNTCIEILEVQEMLGKNWQEEQEQSTQQFVLENQANLEKQGSKVICVYNDSLVQLLNDYALQVLSLKGVVKQTLQLNETEGKVVDTCHSNNHFALFTSLNYIHIYDVSRRELKKVNVSRRFEDSRGPLGNIFKISLNSDASKLAVQLNCCSHFFIYDLELDQFTKHPLNGVILDLAYDQSNKKFLAALLQPQEVGEEAEEEEDEDENERKKMKVAFYYHSSEQGLKKQESVRVEEKVESIFSLEAPHVHLLSKDSSNNSDTYTVEKCLLQDFKNIPAGQLKDKTMVTNIMDFGYNLCINNMEEAYKSVKSIQDPAIWENMAQMCVRSKRLDVAEICIGKMRFGRGSKSIRESKAEPEVQAQMAMVAIQLNMKTEAESLYRECSRWDLLNKMLRADGRYQQSLDLSNSHDRINLSNNHFQMAKHYEAAAQFKEAVHYFQLSNTHRQHVVNMFLEAGQLAMLEEYVSTAQDPEICGQYAAYLESQNQFAQAIQMYKQADMFHKAVRIYLFNQDLTQATDLCNTTNDQQSCLELGKYLETQNDLAQAMHYYAKSQFYSHAIRLAKQLNNDAEVMSLSQQAHPQVMHGSAAYFAKKGHNEKAVILLIKSKHFQQAMALAVKHKLFDYVKRISQEIENNAEQNESRVNLGSGNSNYQQMAEQFIANQQYDKAVQLLTAGKQYDQALQMCVDHDVMVSEELSNQILKDKESPKYQSQLALIADLARKQGNFDLASRKYIELNQKAKAMKCLIQLGNMQKVISFAQNARQPDIYVLAANCLQASDWHENPDIAKNIIMFYNKAKAFMKLADFYDNCAQLEIDEYKDYDKAYAAIKEAIKFFSRLPESNDPKHNQKLQTLQQKQFFLEKFIAAKNSPGELLQICHQLLDNPSMSNENGIRFGDIYTLMIEFYYEQNDYQNCFDILTQMKNKNINIYQYLDQKVTEHIFKSVGQSLSDGHGPRDNDSHQEGDYIDDEIQEDF